MAKTRSQSRRESVLPASVSKSLSKNLKAKKPKSKNSKIPHEFPNCRVILTRLQPNEISILLSGSKSEPKRVYEMRKREPKLITVAESQKSMKQLVAVSQMALCTSRAIRLWDALKKQKDKDQLKIDDIVCARMAGHRPWPAKVISFQRNGVKLSFFGTHEEGVVKKSEIILYAICKEMLEQYLKVSVDHIPTKTLCYHMSFIKMPKCQSELGNHLQLTRLSNYQKHLTEPILRW